MAHAIEATDADHAWRVVDEDVRAGRFFDRANVATFATDDATLHVFARNLDRAHGGFRDALCGESLNRHERDFTSLCLRIRRDPLRFRARRLQRSASHEPADEHPSDTGNDSSATDKQNHADRHRRLGGVGCLKKELQHGGLQWRVNKAKPACIKRSAYSMTRSVDCSCLTVRLHHLDTHQCATQQQRLCEPPYEHTTPRNRTLAVCFKRIKDEMFGRRTEGKRTNSSSRSIGQRSDRECWRLRPALL